MNSISQLWTANRSANEDVGREIVFMDTGNENTSDSVSHPMLDQTSDYVKVSRDELSDMARDLAEMTLNCQRLLYRLQRLTIKLGASDAHRSD